MTATAFGLRSVSVRAAFAEAGDNFGPRHVECHERDHGRLAPARAEGDSAERCAGREVEYDDLASGIGRCDPA